jgi:hypothetical protein
VPHNAVGPDNTATILEVGSGFQRLPPSRRMCGPVVGVQVLGLEDSEDRLGGGGRAGGRWPVIR